jgi:membrane peptidoglycan carboxypeptidase
MLLRLAALALVVALVCGYAVNAYAQSVFDDLPNITGLDAAKMVGDTYIMDRSGTIQLADVSNGGDRRVTARLGDISPKLIQATVATEDKTFWTNPGFDPGGIARATLSNLRHGGVVSGASGITQQLAKQMFLTPQQTMSRKVQELALAWQLNKTYSKNQILELYLNQNPYGEQQLGIEAASETYFNKHAKDLDLAQASLLAGIPQSPPTWDPVLHFDNSKIRQRQVLDAMVRQGYITQEESDAAYKEPLTVNPPVTHYLAPQFVSYVEGELERLNFKPGRQQLRVTTTLDMGKQTIAENVVKQNLAKQRYRDPYGLTSAMVSMDPKTGQILDYVGSPNATKPHEPDYNQIDFVSGVALNTGSSMKPFTYAAAIDQRLATMDTPIADTGSPPPAPQKPVTLIVPQPGGEQYPVANYDGTSHGIQPLRKTFASSLNIPAVKVEMAVGVAGVVDFMRKLGLHPNVCDSKGNCNPNAPEADYRASLTLGGAPVSLLDEVSAYAVFANLGVYHSPEAILQVTDPNGKVLYQAHPDQTGRPVLDPGVAFIISSIISNDANRTLAFTPGGPLNLRGHKAAAKTGTTDDFHDAVTAGYTPDLVSLVWLGDYKDNKHHMSGSSDAVFVAAPAWHDFMTQALQGVPDNWYQPPPDVQQGPDGSWYLKGATKIDHLPNDSPSPSPSAGTDPNAGGGGGGNPDAGPVEVGKPRPTPTTSPIPIFGGGGGG